MEANHNYTPNNTSRATSSVGSAPIELLGLGAFALAMMGLLAFGYSTRTHNTETAGGGQMSIQAQTPTKQNMVSPMDRNEPPSSSTTGQGASNGERVAPKR